MADIFWTFTLDGELYDADYDSSEEAIQALDEFYAEKIQSENDNIKNNEEFSCDAEIVRFQYDEYGDRDIIFLKNIEANYTHYHGDKAEHGTY